MGYTQNTDVQKIAVVGAGTIGSGWITSFLSRGQNVTVYDPNPEAMERVPGMIAQAWSILRSFDQTIPQDIPAYTMANSLEEAVKGADFVQESGPENEELKTELLSRIDAFAPPDAIIASSSSSLLVSRIQSKCVHPERCLVGHPFNPPYLIPLVEVVAGPANTPAIIRRTEDFYRAMGKQPLVLRKEISGYIANRLQNAVFKESLHLVAEGVASIAEIDAAMTYGPGLRWAFMGPFLTFALGGGKGGMRRYFEIFEEEITKSWQELGTPELTPELVETVIEQSAEFFENRSIDETILWRDQSLAQIRSLAQKISKQN